MQTKTSKSIDHNSKPTVVVGGTKHLWLPIVLVLLLINQVAQAQNSANEIVKAQMIDDWKRAKQYTQEFLEVMPADKYSFKPEKGAMNFAQQLLHLSRYNYNLGVGATGGSLPYGKRTLEQEAGLQTKDSVDHIVLASYDALIAGLQKLDAATLFDKVNGGMSRYVTLLKAFEHQTHHRGAAAVYIRMAGITPPHERLF